jgi:acyl-CoA thioesterase I
MNRLLQGALALMLTGLGVVSYKAWRYRSDARTWHDRWLALHSDPAHRSRYRAENERIRNEGVVPGRVVFLGASITDQLDLAGEFPGVPFINRGDGGQLVWQQLLRLEPDALELRPEMVVIKMCAINMLPDAPPFEETQFYFAQMADQVRGHGSKLVFATTVPVTRAWDRAEAGGNATPKIRRFNEWVRDQARMRRDMILDYASVLSDDEGYLPDSLSDDGLHPNQAGRRRMIGLIRSVLIEGRGGTAPRGPIPPGAVPPPDAGAAGVAPTAAVDAGSNGQHYRGAQPPNEPKDH